jgi:hypothetical protein
LYFSDTTGARVQLVVAFDWATSVATRLLGYINGLLEPKIGVFRGIGDSYSCGACYEI